MIRPWQTTLGLAALALAGSAFAADNYAVVRTRMPDNLGVTSVQKTADAAACRKAKDDYVKEMRAKCPTCKVESSSCTTKLSGAAKDLEGSGPLKNPSITAGDTRLLLTGASAKTAPACEQMAKELSAKGVTASCVAPGKAR